MAGKAKVVLTDYVWESLEVEKKTLSGLAELVALQTKKPDEFIAAGQRLRCAAQHLRRAPSPPTSWRRCPSAKSLRATASASIRSISTPPPQAGIIVTNNPTYCIEEVAEHTMALLLSAARKIAFYDRQVRAGQWAVPPGKPLFRLSGSTLGLVGFGNIARQVAVRAAAFGMRVLFADPFIKAGQFDAPGEKAELPAMLGASRLHFAASAAHAANAQDDQRRSVFAA